MKDRLAKPGRLRTVSVLVLLILAGIMVALIAIVWLRGAPVPGRMVEIPLDLPSPGSNPA